MTYSSTRNPKPETRNPQGFTLLELLVTIAIVSILLGLGVAGYLGLRQNLTGAGALSRLESTLRRARNSAVGSRTFSHVRLDMKTGRVYAVGFRTVGQWHFEDDDLTGALGINAVAHGTSLHPRGKIGRCVKFPEKTRGHLTLGSRFDFSGGGYLEAFFRPMRYGTEQVLFAKDKHLQLLLDKEGRLHANVRKIRCDAGAYRLPLYRWSKVALQWTTQRTGGEAHTEVLILVSDVERGRGAGPGAVTRSDKPLTIGDRQRAFYGLVDEVRVLAAVHGEPWKMPAGLTPQMFAGKIRTIHFDSQGQLDARYHAGPVTLAFVHNDQTLYQMTVGRLGTVQQIKRSRYDPSSVKKSPKSSGSGVKKKKKPRRK